MGIPAACHVGMCRVPCRTVIHAETSQKKSAKFGAARDAKLAVDSGQTVVDGSRRQDQLSQHVATRHAGSNQARDFELAVTRHADRSGGLWQDERRDGEEGVE
ncbi:MAG: hypothetical protein ACI8V4_003168 [Ilumatobacter sp.]|jgi:hypothetical protein